MADSYLDAKIRKFVFSKELRIFAAKKFEIYRGFVCVATGTMQRSLICGVFCRFNSADVFW